MYNCSYDRNCDFGCGTCNTYGKNCEGNCNCSGNSPLYDTESAYGCHHNRCCCCCCCPDVDAEVAELYECLKNLPKDEGTKKQDCACSTYCCGWSPWGFFNCCMYSNCGGNSCGSNNCGCNNRCGCNR